MLSPTPIKMATRSTQWAHHTLTLTTRRAQLHQWTNRLQATSDYRTSRVQPIVITSPVALSSIHHRHHSTAAGSASASSSTTASVKPSLCLVPPIRPAHEEVPFDLVIVGGGIIGLACAREMALRFASHSTAAKRVRTIAVVESESSLAQHQSSHNSGVIHAGIYYAPGTARAELCRRGSEMMYDYCAKNDIPTPQVGKLIVATDRTEFSGLDRLMERGLANGCQDLRMINSDEIRRLEPNVRGERAILSPHTGIVRFGVVAQHFARDFQQMNGKIYTNFKVTSVRCNDQVQMGGNGVYTLQAESGSYIRASKVIVCGGIYADRLASHPKFFRATERPTIVPVRGSWLQLKPEYTQVVQRNIYPVPNSEFPFLGVHFTPTLNDAGQITGMIVGPNAVLATSRQGYSITQANLNDMADFMRDPALRVLIRKNWRYGLTQVLEELFPSLAIKQCQRYVPSFNWSHIQTIRPFSWLPYERPDYLSGVRAQALTSHGTLEEDFVIQEQRYIGDDEGFVTDPNATSTTDTTNAPNKPTTTSPQPTGPARPTHASILHIRNAPSPAATSSLAIAQYVADRAQRAFRW